MYYAWPEEEGAYPASMEASLGQEPGSRQYLFGSDLLVAPVTTPGQRARRVYLPALAAPSCAWADFYDASSTYPGGQWVNASAPLAHLPVFKRGSGC